MKWSHNFNKIYIYEKYNHAHNLLAHIISYKIHNCITHTSYTIIRLYTAY